MGVMIGMIIDGYLVRFHPPGVLAKPALSHHSKTLMLHCNHDYDVEHYEFKTGEAAESRANSFCASGSSDYSLGQIPGSDHSIATFFAEISGQL